MAQMALIASTILLVPLCASIVKAQSVIDVTKHGAKAGGSDINEALTSAWKEACASARPSKVLIPQGTFSLGPVILEGPCKTAIEFEIKGILKASTETKQSIDAWVKFLSIEQFTLSGGGTFDGQGAKGWGRCDHSEYCKQLPINIRFDFITNGVARDITSLDSKQFHVNVLGCKNLTFERFTIIAPAKSPNTDGIHIGRSNGIKITNSNIRTGDDCISMGDGSQQILITNVTCGPGHGISIGSLGKMQNEDPVAGVTVKDCTLNNTDNGVRIKTWPASYEGSVSNVHFEDINMVNVSNPIIIDQVYCPWNKCNPKFPSRVKLSDVSFKNIQGTSATANAVKLICSGGVPCQGVKIGNIDLQYNGKEGLVTSECSNIKPIISGEQNPRVCGSLARPTLASPP